MDTGDLYVWERFRAGDRSAFLSIYDQHFPLLCRYCFQITPDKQLIEDVIHDLFVALWDRREHLGRVHSTKAYLMVSTRRQLIRQLQRNTGEELSNKVIASSFELAIEPTLKSYLPQALKSLNDRQREMIYLKFYNNLSNQEIAEITNTKLDTVYKTIQRTLRKLKEQLPTPTSTLLFVSSALLAVLAIFR